MKSIISDVRLIARCGLYCGACRRYLQDKCQGCRLNDKASWCGIRKCVREKGLSTCAGCGTEVIDCKTYSNFIAKIFAFIFKSDRQACIRFIKEHGEQAYADEMTKRECQTFKRK